jgi:Xaa-Pro dipeptidase
MASNRLESLYQNLKQQGLDALVLNPGPSLVYLTGLHFHLMERPTVLILAPGRTPVLILPELEGAKIAGSTVSLQTFPYNDNPATWGEAFQKACTAIDLHGKVGVEPIHLRFLELNYLQTAAPRVQFVSGETVLGSMRMQKDEGEIAKMRKAVEIAQHALLQTLPMVKAGLTERDIAAELTLQMIRAGADTELPFAPIVSSGPNAGNPHATPSERRLGKGETLVIDWGAYYQGYCSDLTRTFAIGKADPEWLKIAGIVERANAAGRSAGQVGLPAGVVDRAAREVIEKAGYGVYFTHRTGHGLGLEGHEPPYMFGENSLVLAAGMTYTVEPGIYRADGGVRIEDNIVVTDKGPITLSDLPRDLLVIG